jgi:hypothetical protein
MASFAGLNPSVLTWVSFKFLFKLMSTLRGGVGYYWKNKNIMQDRIELDYRIPIIISLFYPSD